MVWITPRYLVTGFFAGQSLAFRSLKSGGFQDIFDAMIKDQKIDIIHNYDVQVKPEKCMKSGDMEKQCCFVLAIF